MPSLERLPGFARQPVEEEGLDREAVFAAISKGAAGSSQMINMAPRIFAEDFAPGFFAKHFIKDMKIALEEAAR